MRVTVISGCLVTVAWGASLALEAETSDPFYGTWVLEPARSHYAQEAPPQRMTLIIEPTANGIDYRSDAQYAGGRSTSAHFVARFDGTPALVVGTAGLLAPVSLTRVAEAAIDAVYTSGSTKVAWSHWSVDNQARELLVTTTYLDAHGDEQTNVAAFRREKPNDQAHLGAS